MIMAVIHISAAEAARDFTALLARVRAGAEIVIEGDEFPAVLLRAVPEPDVRLLSDSLRLAKDHGSTVTLDSGFADDLQSAINSHPEPILTTWD
jgi:antitoxin (DNA-binding transcriptional repressor) of toxin-antitoxin stability system